MRKAQAEVVFLLVIYYVLLLHFYILYRFCIIIFLKVGRIWNDVGIQSKKMVDTMSERSFTSIFFGDLFCFITVKIFIMLTLFFHVIRADPNNLVFTKLIIQKAQSIASHDKVILVSMELGQLNCIPRPFTSQ